MTFYIMRNIYESYKYSIHCLFSNWTNLMTEDNLSHMLIDLFHIVLDRFKLYMIGIKIFLALYCFLSSIGIMSSCAVLSFFIASMLYLVVAFTFSTLSYGIFSCDISPTFAILDGHGDSKHTFFFLKGPCLILI